MSEYYATVRVKVIAFGNQNFAIVAPVDFVEGQSEEGCTIEVQNRDVLTFEEQINGKTRVTRINA